jgi:hypothetical protein
MGRGWIDEAFGMLDINFLFLGGIDIKLFFFLFQRCIGKYTVVEKYQL